MADGSKIIYDDEGHARYFSFTREGSAATVMAMDARTVAPQAVTPQQAAKKFLAEHAEILQLPHTAMQSMDVRAAVAPVTENEALRFESEKHTMDSTVVSYNQTMFGLPIYQAGVSVVMHGADNSVKAATSTLHYDIAAQPPSDTLTTRSSLDNAATGAHDDVVRKAIPAAPNMRINRTRLMVYRYDAARREHHDAGEHGFGAQPPTLPLPPLPASIRDGNHYVVVEALFSYPLPDWGMLNWQAFIEPDSGAVLFLRALVDGRDRPRLRSRSDHQDRQPRQHADRVERDTRCAARAGRAGKPRSSGGRKPEPGRHLRGDRECGAADTNHPHHDHAVQFRVCLPYRRFRRGQRLLSLRPVLPHGAGHRVQYCRLLRRHRVPRAGRSPRVGQ